MPTTWKRWVGIAFAITFALTSPVVAFVGYLFWWPRYDLAQTELFCESATVGISEEAFRAILVRNDAWVLKQPSLAKLKTGTDDGIYEISGQRDAAMCVSFCVGSFGPEGVLLRRRTAMVCY